MSEHKTSFESDIESLDISEDFALVGLNNGSIACISIKEKETKWINKFSNNIPITATLIQTNENNQTLFFAGNNDGQLAVFDDSGKALLLKQCKRSAIFGLLGLGHPYIVVYYPGGNEEYALYLKEDECILQKVYACPNSGNYSIKRDLEEKEDLKWEILKGREEGLYAIERYNCMTPARTDRILGLQLSKHHGVMFAFAFPSGNQKCLKDFLDNEKEISKFPIFGLIGNISHYIRFGSPVKNVMNNTWNTKEGKIEKESVVYFLLENGDLHEFNWGKLANPDEGMLLTDETRQVINSSGDNRKITLAGFYDNKICFVFNHRELEISSNKQVKKVDQEVEENIETDVFDLGPNN